MSKYLNPTALITGILAAAIVVLAFNKVAIVRKFLGGPA